MMTTSRNKIHLSAKTIIRLMYRMSELIIIMGKYLGIYAKDSLDELLLTTHHSSSYGGKSREVERKAFSQWMDWIQTSNETSDEVSNIEIDSQGRSDVRHRDVCWDSNDYNYNEDNLGDSFPYIKGHKPWV